MRRRMFARLTFVNLPSRGVSLTARVSTLVFDVDDGDIISQDKPKWYLESLYGIS